MAFVELFQLLGISANADEGATVAVENAAATRLTLVISAIDRQAQVRQFQLNPDETKQVLRGLLDRGTRICSEKK